ncbi:replication protein A 70 kDa DNA-binding subunit B-like isoform X2 [Coffea arabica]|uniref:Replication protein A 70 kDa DNA-binding subunit B-like isoform X2 n=1 Tax=Coffea arabica TaxID=13443 RepID=A0ABM4V2G8_COFAR
MTDPCCFILADCCSNLRMDDCLSIEEILPGMKSWSAKIIVQEKRQPATASASPTRYQKLIFVDAKGSQVEGILFNHAIQVMGPRLTVFKRYKISNAEVRLIDEKYRTDGLTTQWVISTKTVVEELPDDTDMMPTRFSYTMFKDLAQFMEQKNQFVDILAVVISVLPVTSFTNEFGTGRVQKFVVINEEKLPLQLSLFNEFIDNEGQKIAENMNNFPVIVCRRLKVKPFNGIALSTRKDSTILIDPPIQEAMLLKNWATENAMLFVQVIKDKSYARYNPDLFTHSSQKFTLIYFLQSTQKFAWVRASMSFENIFQRYWYMACKKSFKAIDASYGYSYSCNKCSEHQKATPRCRFDVILSDKSGRVTATLFGDLAEKLLTYSALDAMQYFHKNIELPLMHVHEALRAKEFAVQIQPAASHYGDPQQRYTILHYYESNFAEASTQQTIESPGSFLLESPLQIPTAETQDAQSPITSVQINLASKFDEAATPQANSPETSPELISASKKPKLA